jgi:hypothetical protein
VTADDYLRLVTYELRDLPWRTKRELASELERHLAELPADTDYLQRLGRPEQYAAEMRSAAGLERQRGLISFLRARRLRNLIAIVVVLTLSGLAISAVVWVDSYQPITFAGGTQLPLHARTALGQAGYSVVFRKGRPFEYGITIYNSGRFTVRVLGVSRSVTDFFKGRLLMSEDQTGRLDERPLKRFHPFDMKPGSYRWLVFKGVYACTTGMGSGPGVAITWGAFPVRFSFLWRTATASIPLDAPLGFSFPKGCPPAKSTPTP